MKLAAVAKLRTTSTGAGVVNVRMFVAAAQMVRATPIFRTHARMGESYTRLCGLPQAQRSTQKSATTMDALAITFMIGSGFIDELLVEFFHDP